MIYNHWKTNKKCLLIKDIYKYCANENIPILIEINNDRKIAEGYSNGISILEIYPQYKDKFLSLYHYIERMAGKWKK